jgi:hypothetical protein
MRCPVCWTTTLMDLQSMSFSRRRGSLQLRRRASEGGGDRCTVCFEHISCAFLSTVTRMEVAEKAPVK